MDERTLYKAWGQRIAARRQELDIRQVELADRIGVSQQRVSAYESGARRPPDVLRPRIAEALASTIEELFSYEAEPAGDAA